MTFKKCHIFAWFIVIIIFGRIWCLYFAVKNIMEVFLINGMFFKVVLKSGDGCVNTSVSSLATMIIELIGVIVGLFNMCVNFVLFCRF